MINLQLFGIPIKTTKLHWSFILSYFILIALSFVSFIITIEYGKDITLVVGILVFYGLDFFIAPPLMIFELGIFSEEDDYGHRGIFIQRIIKDYIPIGILSRIFLNVGILFILLFTDINDAITKYNLMISMINIIHSIAFLMYFIGLKYPPEIEDNHDLDQMFIQNDNH